MKIDILAEEHQKPPPADLIIESTHPEPHPTHVYMSPRFLRNLAEIEYDEVKKQFKMPYSVYVAIGNHVGVKHADIALDVPNAIPFVPRLKLDIRP